MEPWSVLNNDTFCSALGGLSAACPASAGRRNLRILDIHPECPESGPEQQWSHVSASVSTTVSTPLSTKLRESFHNIIFGEDPY